MKISCDVIRDILPLYAEDMVSNATREVVEEHLCGCEECSGELETLKKTQKLPVEVGVSSLKRVGDSIRRRRILAVMAVFLFITTVLIGGALMLDAKIYLSATEAVEDIHITGDVVYIRWDDRVTGTKGDVDYSNPINYEVTAWTNLYNYLFYKDRVPYEDLDAEIMSVISKEQYEAMNTTGEYYLENPKDTNFIYVHPAKHSMTLILNAGQSLPDGPKTVIYSDILYFIISMAVLSVAFILAGKYFREKWYGELLMRIAMVAGSLAVSVIVVTAGQMYGLENDFREALIDSTAVTLPMCLFGLCLRQLIKLNRQDKGL